MKNKILCTFDTALTNRQHSFHAHLFCLFVPRLPILPYRKRAEGHYQGPHWTLQWHFARFIRPLCLYYAQGAGQTVRYCKFKSSHGRLGMVCAVNQDINGAVMREESIVMPNHLPFLLFPTYVKCCFQCQVLIRFWDLCYQSPGSLLKFILVMHHEMAYGKDCFYNKTMEKQRKQTDKKNKPWKTPNSFFLFPGEPLHGYRVCIQAILQDKPKIATQNLPEVSECVSLIPAHNWQITASLHLSALNVLLLSFLKTGYLKFFKLAVSVLLSNLLGICLFLSAYNNMYVCMYNIFFPSSLVSGVIAVSSESSSEVFDYHVGSWSSWILWPQPGTTG